MNVKIKKPYWEMNREELAEATREFDQEFIGDTFRPMTAAERSNWERIRNAPGRPRVGKGVKVISLSIEKDLLMESDRMAKKLGISRAKLVSYALRPILGRKKAG